MPSVSTNGLRGEIGTGLLSSTDARDASGTADLPRAGALGARALPRSLLLLGPLRLDFFQRRRPLKLGHEIQVLEECCGLLLLRGLAQFDGEGTGQLEQYGIALLGFLQLLIALVHELLRIPPFKH